MRWGVVRFGLVRFHGKDKQDEMKGKLYNQDRTLHRDCNYYLEKWYNYPGVKGDILNWEGNFELSVKDDFDEIYILIEEDGTEWAVQGGGIVLSLWADYKKN
jgi:hypothetical protein